MSRRITAMVSSVALAASFSLASDVHEERTTIELELDGRSYTKRFVVRYPSDGDRWNGRLVIGAHGGSGGDSYSRDGQVIGTDEVSLDDVVGDHAVAHGFAYASIDRDGIGGTAEGFDLTKAFAERMRQHLFDAFGREVERTYIAGLSMGGAIARRAAEDQTTPFDGTLIIVGAGGDAAASLARSKKMAERWARIEESGGVEAYARAVGTPVDAKRFWPFMGASAARRGDAPTRDDSTGGVVVPTIEVGGTYDDFVYPELLVYKEKVRARHAAERHRLYEVEGAWHISPEDDAISSFQFIGSRMGLADEILDDMASGTSYLPAVRDALLLLDRWVSTGEAPPADRRIAEGESLLP